MLSKFFNFIMLCIITSPITLCAMEQELKPNSNTIPSAITLYQLEDSAITETLTEEYVIPYEYTISQHAGGFSLPINFQGKVSINNIESKSFIAFCCWSIKNEKRFLSFIHAQTERSFSQLLNYLCTQKTQSKSTDILFHARVFPPSATKMIKLCPTLVVKEYNIANLTIKPDNFQTCTLDLILGQPAILKYKTTTQNESLTQEVYSRILTSENDTNSTTQNSNSQCITS